MNEFIYSFIDGHLGGLQFLAIMNVTIGNIIVQYVSFWNMFSFLLDVHLEVHHCLIKTKNCQTFF